MMHADAGADLPHGGVWARLGASPLHGIGAFALTPIPEGTSVFANDAREIIWIEASEIDAIPAAEHHRLYRDFAIRSGSLLGCPKNFNMLSVGWYVNEPASGEQANLVIAEDFAMIAARNIAAGEELTIIYETFSKNR